MDFNRFTGPLALELCPVFKHARHAFVTWVIQNPSYLKGALVLGSSLRHHCPGILRVCLLSKELENEENCSDLRVVYDYVVVVAPIVAEGKHTRWGRFENMYADWIFQCFTRLQCLRLGDVLGLTKIVVLDADVVAVGDMSELFDIPAPAGILSFGEGQGLPGTQSVMSHAALHGKRLPAALVKQSVLTSYGIRGCLMVLEPKNTDFYHLIDTLRAQPTLMENAIGAYGDNTLHIGPDERLFTEQYQDRYGWTHIHQKFCMTAWHLDRLKEDEVPRSLHFVSKKPWELHDDYFDDFDFWYLEALHLIALHPQLRSRFHDSTLQNRSVDDFSSLASTGLSRFFASKTMFQRHQNKTGQSLLAMFDSSHSSGRVIQLTSFTLEPIPQHTVMTLDATSNAADINHRPATTTAEPSKPPEQHLDFQSSQEPNGVVGLSTVQTPGNCHKDPSIRRWVECETMRRRLPNSAEAKGCESAKGQDNSSFFKREQKCIPAPHSDTPYDCVPLKTIAPSSEATATTLLPKLVTATHEVQLHVSSHTENPDVRSCRSPPSEPNSNGDTYQNISRHHSPVTVTSATSSARDHHGEWRGDARVPGGISSRTRILKQRDVSLPAQNSASCNQSVDSLSRSTLVPDTQHTISGHQNCSSFGQQARRPHAQSSSERLEPLRPRISFDLPTSRFAREMLRKVYSAQQPRHPAAPPSTTPVFPPTMSRYCWFQKSRFRVAACRNSLSTSSRDNMC